MPNWTELYHGLFEIDDGALPGITISGLTGDEIVRIYAHLRSSGEISSVDASFWHNELQCDQPIDSVPNPAELVVSGKAASFQHCISGLTVGAVEIPALGVFVCQQCDYIELDLLHDVLEDTDLGYAFLASEFGKQVADDVQHLTFRSRGDGESDADYARYKAEAMSTFEQKPIGVVMVKMSDRLCNVEDYLTHQGGYAPKYFIKAKPLFDSVQRRTEEIVATFGTSFSQRMVEDYRRVLERSASLTATLSEQQKKSFADIPRL